MTIALVTIVSTPAVLAVLAAYLTLNPHGRTQR